MSYLVVSIQQSKFESFQDLKQVVTKIWYALDRSCSTREIYQGKLNTAFRRPTNLKGPVYTISLAARMSIILSHSEVLLGQNHRNLNCVSMHIFGVQNQIC